MKLWIRSKILFEYEWDIEIEPREETVVAGSILDTQSNEYQSFIEGMIDNFAEWGYELYNDPEYTHKSNKGSDSWYYTFIKVEDLVEIRIVVNVRISDHANKDTRRSTADERRSRYVDKISDELASEFGSSPRPMRVPINIIFDDNHFTSYSGALFQLYDNLKDIEADYQEWRKRNNLLPSDNKGGTGG